MAYIENDVERFYRRASKLLTELEDVVDDAVKIDRRVRMSLSIGIKHGFAAGRLEQDLIFDSYTARNHLERTLESLSLRKLVPKS